MYNRKSVDLRMDPCWKSKYAFEKSSSNNINLKYNFLFKAIITISLLKNLKILVSLESHGWVEYCNGNYFGKKEELKLKKRRWIFLTFFVKLLRIANLISKKKFFFLIIKMQVLFWYIPGLPLCQEYQELLVLKRNMKKKWNVK